MEYNTGVVKTVWTLSRTFITSPGTYNTPTVHGVQYGVVKTVAAFIPFLWISTCKYTPVVKTFFPHINFTHQYMEYNTGSFCGCVLNGVHIIKYYIKETVSAKP